MARNESIMLAAGEWVEITNTDTSVITFVNQGSDYVRIAVTDGSQPQGANGILFASNEGVAAVELKALFPGVKDPKRVWCFGECAQEVFVSYA